MIYVKEWNNRYNCTAIKKNAFHLTKVTDDVMPKIPKYQQKRWWSQSGRFCITNGHEKVVMSVCLLDCPLYVNFQCSGKARQLKGHFCKVTSARAAPVFPSPTSRCI